MSKLCPSAQPGMDRCQVIGVVRRNGPAPVVEYINQRLPASEDVLAWPLR